MAEYLLSVHYVDGVGATPEAEMQEAFERVDKFNAELQASGAWVFAGGLHTPDVATVVKVVDDEVVMTDGPFAESKEQLGGFWIINVADLDAALKVAEAGSRACSAPVEVRPFQGPDDDAAMREA